MIRKTEIRKQDALSEMYKEMGRETAEFRGLALRMIFGIGTLTVAGTSWFLRMDKSDFEISHYVLIAIGLTVLYLLVFIFNYFLHKYFNKAIYGLCNIETAFFAFDKGFYLEERTLLPSEWSESYNPKLHGEPIFFFGYIFIVVFYIIIVVGLLFEFIN